MINLSLLILLSAINMQQTKEQHAVFGGGCFWCTEAIFKAIDGVSEVVPGYSGGDLKNPTYNDICTGETGHAEVINIKFDTAKVSYEKLLEVFFLTHDPTTLNRQGADVGTQYRSVVFFTNEDQKNSSMQIIQALNEKKVYPNSIVTEVAKLTDFYPAEKYHRDYFERNGNQPYCRMVIQPKYDKFKKEFKDMIK